MLQNSTVSQIISQSEQTSNKLRVSRHSLSQSFFTIVTNVAGDDLFIRMLSIFSRLSLNRCSSFIYLHKASGVWKEIDKMHYYRKIQLMKGFLFCFDTSLWFSSEKTCIAILADAVGDKTCHLSSRGSQRLVFLL